MSRDHHYIETGTLREKPRHQLETIFATEPEIHESHVVR
jgi:hypothetical protein